LVITAGTILSRLVSGGGGLGEGEVARR
jgi:hypothetical protein